MNRSLSEIQQELKQVSNRKQEAGGIMVSRDKIIQTIFDVIDELKQQVPVIQQLDKSVDTVLFGQSGQLDSLGLVNLIVATEQKIEEEFGVAMTLADEKALSRKSSPFRTIGTLADYISLLLEKSSSE